MATRGTHPIFLPTALIRDLSGKVQVATYENVLDPKLCAAIRKAVPPEVRVPGTISQSARQNFQIRKSKVAWLPLMNDIAPAVHRIVSALCDSAQCLFLEEISSLECFQYTEYHGTDRGFYGLHMDRIEGSEAPSRKLSITLQLSDPKEYEGGELKIIGPTGTVFAHPEAGAMTVFRSNLLHCVTPVTTGKRCSLVNWASGNY
jgi:PKHD-type hydroxylase